MGGNCSDDDAVGLGGCFADRGHSGKSVEAEMDRDCAVSIWFLDGACRMCEADKCSFLDRFVANDDL